MTWYGVTSYGVSVVAYGATAVLLLFGRSVGARATSVVVAASVTAIWAAIAAIASIRGGPSTVPIAFDAAHALVWTLAILSFLESSTSGGANLVRRWLGGGASALAVAAVGLLAFDAGAQVARPLVFVVLVSMAVTGLLAVEQVLRNATEEQRNRFRLLCLAIGGIFTVDLFVYSHAMLLGGVDPLLWDSRGLANAIGAPLILAALRRAPAWTKEIFVSRYIAFYTASLLGVGAYLLCMGVVAYAIRSLGGQWGVYLELVFLAAALLVLAVVIFSTTLRARLRVLLVKHFYRSKYDYRKEWLRLTEALAKTSDMRSLALSALEGIAAIVGSPAGNLWITTDGKQYDWLASFGANEARTIYGREHPMVAFLASERWIIDSKEYEQFPDRYGNAFGASSAAVLPPSSLIVPLDSRGHLQGFIVLERPPGIGRLNFDDHDILKTAGKQVAVFLSQALAQEELVATRQFEAVNKLTTFLVHDLKNVLAQQELVVANAQRFGERPEFIRDAIATISSGVQRMKKVLAQLRSGVLETKAVTRANLSKVLLEVAAQCVDRQPAPELAPVDEQISVDMDPNQLVSALVHIVRNAQDATPPEGRVAIATERRDGEVRVLVSDTGSGMDHEFVRDRLFAPFKSTKGKEGMGIGAYQARELVRAAGGRVEVSSEPGRGTIFKVVFPYERVLHRALP